MLSDTIIPDNRYFYHSFYNDTLRKYSDRGYIILVNDFKIIVNDFKTNVYSLKPQTKSVQFDSLLDSIPCGINCSENLLNSKLASNDVFANGKLTFRNYIEYEIDETSIKTLCFVLTTDQYDDIMREIKCLLWTVPQIQIVECWYDQTLSNCTNYIYESIKLRNIFMDELHNINDELITKFLNMWPIRVNYEWYDNDRGKLMKYKRYIQSKYKTLICINKNGLYPWCKICLDKEQKDILDSILIKYPQLQNDLNPQVVKRNSVVMLRDGDRAIPSKPLNDKNSFCVLL